MNFWKQVPNATKIYLVITIYLIVLFCGLAILRQYRESPDHFSLSWLLSRAKIGIDETPSPDSAEIVSTSTMRGDAAWLRAKTNTRILEGPGEKYPEIAWLEDNQITEIVGASDDGKWWAIKLPYFANGMGWVLKSEVESNRTELVRVITPESAIQPFATTSDQMPTGKAIANINIRSGPDLKYQKIGTLEIDKSAEIIGMSADEFWYLIKIPGTENLQGWVSRDYIIVQNAEKISIVGENNDFESTLSPSSAYLLAKATLNVRNGPDITFAVIGQLESGELAEILGKTSDGLWWAIQFSGASDEQGWVASAYADAKNVENVPVIP